MASKKKSAMQKVSATVIDWMVAIQELPLSDCEKIAKLIDALHTLRSGLHATGRDPSLTNDLVSRAYRATFGKTIEHRGRVEKSKALIGQGKSVMGSSTRSATPPKKTAQVDAGGVHPEVAKWWSENVTNPTAS